MTPTLGWIGLRGIRLELPRNIRFIGFLLAFAVGLPCWAGAQSVRGVVVDPFERPVSGVVLALTDSNQVVVARAITLENGEYRLLARRPGTYSLRAMRIGFQPVTIGPLVLGVSTVINERVVMNGARVLLDTVRVARQSVCGRQRAGSDASHYATWEQAMTSITATAMTTSTTSSMRGITSTALDINRVLDPAGKTIRSQEVVSRTENVRQPWKAQDADALRRDGYVRVDAKGWYTYDAPGLDVLTAPYFLEDHCLRLVAGRDTTEIGVQFEPAPSRRRLSEITGTLWLTRATAALRRMDFGFVNAPDVPQSANDVTGGNISFAHLPDGGVVISSWELRMPQLERYTARSRSVTVSEVRSNGGQVVVLRRGNDTLYKRPAVAVSGVVLDSVSGRAIARANVSLKGTKLSALTANDGAFVFPDVLAGTYDLAVRTPSLDSIRAASQMNIVAIDGMAPLRIKVPTANQLATQTCGPALTGSAGKGKGAVIGTLRDRVGAGSSGKVTVVADWTEYAIGSGNAVPRRIGKRMSTSTDSVGGFRICGVPTETVLTVRALPATGLAKPVTVRLAPDDRFVAAALVVDETQLAVGSLTGVVVADSSENLLSDAEVTIPKLTLSTRSNERGEFFLADIPVGTHDLLIRRVGYGAVSASLTFSANEEEDRRIVLKRLNVLDSVSVTATRLDMGLLEFEENRKLGLGRFLTRDNLEAQRNQSMTNIMGMVSGAGVVRGRTSRGWIMAKRYAGTANIYRPDTTEMLQGMVAGCYSQVWVDNILMNPSTPTEPFDLTRFSPDQIESVEFYAGPSQTPARYATLNSVCGTMVIHTRRHDSKK